MDKKRILVVPSDLAGVGHARSIWPAQEINQKYSDDFYVEINHQPDFNDRNYLKSFDIIHFHRQLGPHEIIDELFKDLKNAGVLLIMDLDDYWDPPVTHPLYQMAIKEKLSEKIIKTMRKSDYVTTTTEIFAEHIRKFNKNVVVMPNGLDPKHPMWQNEKNIIKDERVRFGFAGGSCYDNQTEILTENGFKFFKDLSKNEKVACLNPSTNELEYHIPSNYIKEPYSGKLQCGVNNIIDYAVTPNHKMYVAFKHKRKMGDFSLIESDKIFNQNIFLKKDAIWHGFEKEYFTLPALEQNLPNIEPLLDLSEEEIEMHVGQNGTIIDKITKKIKKVVLHKSTKNNYYFRTIDTEHYDDNRQLNMNLWLKFFGFWIAEGWTTQTNNLYQVGVAQTKQNGFLDEMFNTLQALGFNPTYTKDKKQIRVFDKQLWSYLSQFGKAENKFIPRELLCLPKNQLSILLDWYLKGDGSVEKGGIRFDKRIKKDGTTTGNRTYNSCRKRAYTVSKSLANDIQEICLKIGVTSSITNRGLRNSTMNDGRTINAKHDAFVISVGSDNEKRNKATSLLKAEKQFEIDYNDYVYCVTVPNNIIFVRRNGKTMWCGNSHYHDLLLMEKSMKLLHNDENLKGKYQIVMCGYDVRGHMTMVDENGNTQGSRKIFPHETIWNKFEEIFTDNYNSNLISPEYQKYLKKYKIEPYQNVLNENYVRRWTLPLTQYGKHYNYFDVSLAPLIDNTFNQTKSELKIIEAGMKKKVLIAQDFSIYKKFLKHGENAMLVNKTMNEKGWYNCMKRLIEDSELREKLANNLHEFVKDRYNIENLTSERVKTYIQLIDEHKINRKELLSVIQKA